MRRLARAVIVAVVSVVLVACSGISNAGPKRAADDGKSARATIDILDHSGRWITDSFGRVVIVHGVNMVAKRAPYEPSADGFGRDDADFLAANGFTAVRLGVIFKGVEPILGQYDDRYLDQIESTVDILGEAGIRSLLDFHQDAYNEVFGGEGFPDWAVPPQYRGPFASRDAQGKAMYNTNDMFWANTPRSDGVHVQDEYAKAVAHVAARFATNRYVLGYDLINEPLAGFSFPECRATPVDCSGFDRALGAFQQLLITAIRGVDVQHLIWYEPNTLFDWGVPTQLPPFTDSRLGMSFHSYCPPTPTCDRYVHMRNAVQRSDATGDAIMMTEFWSMPPDAAAVTNAADSESMSWMVWAYCGCNDPTGSIPPVAEGLVRDPARPPAGDNVDASKLRVLARPYPHVVAGTPQRLTFDPKTKSFEFEYTTARADGKGNFDANACTQILVPGVQYPGGYKVDASGATVVSAAGAGVLSVRSTGTTPQITIRITPNVGSATRPIALSDGC